jgi:hypothetical protein
MSILESLKRRQEKESLSVYVNCETIEKIDNYRGQVPRSWLVQEALNEFLERELAVRMSASGVADKKEK